MALGSGAAVAAVELHTVLSGAYSYEMVPLEPDATARIPDHHLLERSVPDTEVQTEQPRDESAAWLDRLVGIGRELAESVEMGPHIAPADRELDTDSTDLVWAPDEERPKTVRSVRAEWFARERRGPFESLVIGEIGSED